MPDNKPANSGAIHISEDVIAELARKTIQGIPHIRTSSKLGSKFGLGRKSEGIHVSVEPSEGYIDIDTFVFVKYGQRIPDLAWDVQEKIKDNLERYTGYNVRAVNVNVQGIYSDSGDSIKMDEDPDQSGQDDEED